MTKDDYVDKIKSHEIIPAIYSEVFKKVFTSFESREYTCRLLSEITGINYDFLLDNLIVVNDDESLKINSSSVAKLLVKDLALILEIKKSHKTRLVFQNNLYKNDYISRIINIDHKNSLDADIYLIVFDLHDLYKKTFSEFKFMEIETGEMENCSYQKYHVNVFKILDKYYHKKDLSYKEKLIAVLALDNKYDLLDICKTDRILNTVFDILKNIKTKGVEDKIMSFEYQQRIIDIEKEYEQIETNKIGRISVVKNMLIDKLDFNIISKYTDISVEEVRKINENKN